MDQTAMMITPRVLWAQLGPVLGISPSSSSARLCATTPTRHQHVNSCDRCRSVRRIALEITGISAVPEYDARATLRGIHVESHSPIDSRMGRVRGRAGDALRRGRSRIRTL